MTIKPVTKERKRRRARGSGSTYQKHVTGCSKQRCGCTWWIAYKGPDGRRHAESAESARKGDAERLLQRRVGARENNLPVIPRAERLTVDEAVKAVIHDYIVNGERSLRVVERRINKHLLPFFGGKRMVGITTATVNAYVAHRLTQGIRNQRGERIADVSNAEINRELTLLKRCFSLAMQSGRIAMRPHIGMLQESAPRSGFLERDQIASVVAHLPPALRPVVEFAYITGWRTASEVLPLERRNVDFKAGEVTIDPGASKNGEPRVFPMTADLRVLLDAQQREHERLKQAGHIIPQVFFRLVAQGRGADAPATFTSGPSKPRPRKTSTAGRSV